MTSFHFIYDGYGDHPIGRRFDPFALCDTIPGLSGTEAPMFGMAFELARRGHQVTVFSRFQNTGVCQGVCFLDLDEYELSVPDVAVAFHDGRPLKRWRAHRKVALHQSYSFPNEALDGWDFADIYLTATERCAEFHRRRLGKPFGVVPNGWDLGTYLPWRPVPGRMVFTTSVDRGAHRLLEALPHIRARVPEAHVVMLERGSPGLLGIESGPGLELRKPCSRNQVLELVSTASVYAYPCDPPVPCEVFPLSLLEACATGVPVVLAPDDGLDRLFRGGVSLTPPVKECPRTWMDPFVDEVCRVLTERSHADNWSSAGKHWASGYVFEKTTTKFLEAINQ